MKKIAILSLSLLILILGIFGFLGLINSKVKRSMENTTSLPKPNVITNTNQKDWITYKNSKAGFQFSYPPRFSKLPQGYPKLTGEEDNTSSILFGEGSEKGLLLGILPAVKGISLNQYFQQSLVLLKEENKKFFKEENIKVDSVDGLRVRLSDGKTIEVFS